MGGEGRLAKRGATPFFVTNKLNLVLKWSSQKPCPLSKGRLAAPTCGWGGYKSSLLLWFNLTRTLWAMCPLSGPAALPDSSRREERDINKTRPGGILSLATARNPPEPSLKVAPNPKLPAVGEKTHTHLNRSPSTVRKPWLKPGNYAGQTLTKEPRGSFRFSLLILGFLFSKTKNNGGWNNS